MGWLKEKRQSQVHQLQLEKLLLKEENLHLLLLLMKQKKLLQLLKSQLRKLLNEIQDVCLSSQLLILLQYLFVSPLTTNKIYTQVQMRTEKREPTEGCPCCFA